MRGAAIHLRPKPEQIDLIDRAAAVVGTTRSNFILQAACDRARSVLVDQVFFRLDDRRFENSVRQLDAPPAMTEGLAKLMNLDLPWAAPGGKKE